MSGAKQSERARWRDRPTRISITATASLVFGLARALPLTLASNIGGFLGRTVGNRFMKHRNFIRNLSTAFPDMKPAEVEGLLPRIYDNIGRVAAESAHLGDYATGRRGAMISIEGHEHLPKPGPAVFVGCHLSNWDIGVVAMAREFGALNTIFTPIGVPALDTGLARNRLASGATYLPRNRTTLKAILDGLESGVSVAMLVDQRVDSGPIVKFFGHDAKASDFPAKLALRFNIPIIAVDGERLNPKHFIVRFHPPLWPGDYRGANAITDMTQAVMLRLESFIRRAPDSWFCYKLRWKTPKDSTSNAQRRSRQPGL